MMKWRTAGGGGEGADAALKTARAQVVLATELRATGVLHTRTCKRGRRGVRGGRGGEGLVP